MELLRSCNLLERRTRLSTRKFDFEAAYFPIATKIVKTVGDDTPRTNSARSNSSTRSLRENSGTRRPSTMPINQKHHHNGFCKPCRSQSKDSKLITVPPPRHEIQRKFTTPLKMQQLSSSIDANKIILKSRPSVLKCSLRQDPLTPLKSVQMKPETSIVNRGNKFQSSLNTPIHAPNQRTPSRPPTVQSPSLKKAILRSVEPKKQTPKMNFYRPLPTRGNLRSSSRPKSSFIHPPSILKKSGDSRRTSLYSQDGSFVSTKSVTFDL